MRLYCPLPGKNRQGSIAEEQKPIEINTSTWVALKQARGTGGWCSGVWGSS